MENERLHRGLQKLHEVDGAEGMEIVEQLGDLGQYIAEFAFGDIYSRGGLTLREREIATIAMLTCMSGREPQLKVHIQAGLHVGLSPKEIEEVILQTIPYSGFPTAINAWNIHKAITQELAESETV